MKVYIDMDEWNSTLVDGQLLFWVYQVWAWVNHADLLADEHGHFINVYA